jgi:hypothetical protein
MSRLYLSQKILNTYEHYAKKPKPLRRPSNARPTALAPTLTFSQLVARSSSASLSANANPIPSTKPVPVPEPTPQNISLTRKGKKRIQPSFMGNADGSSSSSSAFGVGTSAQAPANAFYRPPPQHQQPDASSSFVPKPSPLGQNSSSSQPRRVPLTTQPLNFPLSQASSFSNANNANIDTDVEMSESGSQPSWSVDSPAQLQRLSANGMGKKRAFDERDGGRDEAATRAVPTRVKARTLGGGGGGSSGGAGPVVELRAGGSGEAIVAAAFTGSSGNVLQALPVKSYLKATIDDSSNSDWVEAKNSLNCALPLNSHLPAFPHLFLLINPFLDFLLSLVPMQLLPLSLTTPPPLASTGSTSSPPPLSLSASPLPSPPLPARTARFMCTRRRGGSFCRR